MTHDALFAIIDAAVVQSIRNRFGQLLVVYHRRATGVYVHVAAITANSLFHLRCPPRAAWRKGSSMLLCSSSLKVGQVCELVEEDALECISVALPISFQSRLELLAADTIMFRFKVEAIYTWVSSWPLTLDRQAQPTVPAMQASTLMRPSPSSSNARKSASSNAGKRAPMRSDEADDFFSMPSIHSNPRSTSA